MPEAVLTLFAAFITGTVLAKGLWSGTIFELTSYINIYTIGFAAFLCLLFFQRLRSPRRELAVFLVVALAFSSIIIIEAARQMEARQLFPKPRYANDGVVQSVEAARFLLHGQNPYTADFGITSFRAYGAAIDDGLTGQGTSRNLAFDHYVYPPLIFLLYVPLVAVSDLTNAMIDFQSWSLLFFFATVGLLLWVSPTWTGRTRLLLLTVGNPFLWVYALAGFSEFVLLFPLALSFVAFDRNKPMLGSIAFGLALAAKQTAWLLLPLWVYWLWRKKTRPAALTGRHMGVAAAVAATILLPFFIWNPGAMYDDMVRYLSGIIPGSFPIANATVAQYLVQYGIIQSPWSPVSLWPMQGAMVILAGWALYRWLGNAWTTSRVLTAASTLTLVATITNRVGADNYFMVPLVLLLLAYAQHTREQAMIKTKPAV